MKKLLLFVLLFSPLSIYAQVSGGQITRREKKKQSTHVQKQNKTSKISSSIKELKRKQEEVELEANRKARDEEERIRKVKEEQKRLEEEKKRPITNLINNMVFVEGGTFIMGANSEDEKIKLQNGRSYRYSKPPHEVHLSNFYIGKYEVTQEEWQYVIGTNPSHFYGAKRPVENVNWNDCQVFINKLNQITGKKFRLPTEAEWEYAARGGCNYYNRYSGSNDTPYEVAWYRDISKQTTHNVGEKAPNKLGIYDMSGNVEEWCDDVWLKYRKGTWTNPHFSIGGTSRVCRGGSWNSFVTDLLVCLHVGEIPSTRKETIGLRLALSE